MRPNTVENNARTTGKRLGGITGKGFMPGCSGNPGGRPKKRPITERYERIIEMRLPEVLHLEIEAMLKTKLPRRFTFGDALAMSTPSMRSAGT